MRAIRAVPLIAVLASPVPQASAADRLQVGGTLGLAFEQEMFGSGRPSGVILGTGELLLGAGLVMKSGHPRLQALSGLMAGQSFRPNSRFLVGGVTTVRLHLRPERRFGGYLEAGAGVTSSALQVRELDGWMQYYLHGGGGVRWVRGDTSLLLGYRLTHLSNHGTTRHNPGLNMHAAVFGAMFTLR
jgi:hypothetical protein